MKYFLELSRESGAFQRTSLLHKNVATEGSVGWLDTGNQVRRSGSASNEQENESRRGQVLIQDKNGRKRERWWLEHKEMLI